MKKNYEAWKINIDNYQKLSSEVERMKFFAQFGVLAPSSHNSQPWKFSFEKNIIKISPEMSRALIHGDNENRLLYISLGCAVQNTIMAAESYGYNVQKSFIDLDNKTSVQLILTQPTEQFEIKTENLFAMLNRVTNRSDYQSEFEENAKNVLSSVENENVSINIFTDKNTRTKIAKIIMEATSDAMSDQKFRNELSDYVKSNITKSSLGMPAFGMGIPLVPSLFAPKMLKAFNMSKVSAKKDEAQLIEKTPAFVVFSTADNKPEDWIEIGEKFEHCAVMLVKLGYSLNPMGAIVQIGEHYKNLQPYLKNPTNRPQMFFRVGKPTKMVHHSPRLTLNEVSAEK